ncbi:MAG: Acg family FMN-binding oxidoreductase [Pseudobdellovibrionaceae bacterium]
MTPNHLQQIQQSTRGLSTLQRVALGQVPASPIFVGNRYNNQIELVKSAILAPSSHNTQPWKFKLSEKLISIFPDFSRRCPAVDPDDHHLYISLGCASENVAQAALSYGLMAQTKVDFDKSESIDLHLSPTKAFESSLFQAIPTRQCTRTEYNGSPISNTELSILEKIGTGRGVHCHLITEKPSLEKILEFVVEGNSAQMKDKAFVTELKNWIRFNKSEAHDLGDGLYSATAGSPNIPTWLGKLIFTSIFTEKSENEKYVKQIRSSAGIAIFSSDKNDANHWVEVGRCFERFALQATSLGLRTAMINQPVELPSIRPLFASYLGLGMQRPDLVVRFGRAPLTTRSMRRELSAVLI